MLVIPIQPVPSQTLRVLLDDQATTLTIRQLGTGLFMSIALDNVAILQNVICENLNLIVRGTYFGFLGDFMFVDNSSDNGRPAQDPYFTGLGTQFSLIYLTPDELR